MAIPKQTINVNFAQGIDTQTDSKQVAVGKFLALSNTVFNKGGLLEKRNGFGALPDIDAELTTALATFNSSLVATSDTLQVYSQDSQTWLDRGNLQPVRLSTVPVVRTANSQTTCDIAVASTGLALVTFTQSSGAYYQVVDSTTGQIVVQATALPATATLPRAFALGRYLIVTFLATVAAATHLQYIAIPVAAPATPGTATDLSTAVSSLAAGYNGAVANNNLYVAVDGNDGGGAIRITYLDATLVQHATVVEAGKTATLMSVSIDTTGTSAVVWVTAYAATNAYSWAYDQSLNVVKTIVTAFTGVTILNITSVGKDGSLTLICERSNTYSYTPASPGTAKTDYVQYLTITQAGVVSSATTVIRSMGLASKAFILSGVVYFLGAYGGVYQPTYFLMNLAGEVVSKLAYSNGIGYITSGVLPSVTVTGTLAQIGYLYKSALTPVNKSQGVANTLGIYSQLGVNLASFEFDTGVTASEIGQSLNLTGGVLTQYDGVKPVEQGFHVWPEDILITTATGSGGLIAQTYYYVAVYEWTDAQGLLHRSAPSIPMAQITTTAASTNTLKVPYLRITAKTGSNPVRIVWYRWSTAQQVFYQISSVASPDLNVTTSDSLTYTDAAADSAILGNQVLYTTGGVVENVAAPAPTVSALFKSRLFTVNAENDNVLSFSKQVIQGVPVEMSDLFTIYVAPTISNKGSTGGVKTLAPLDDKLIIGKQSAFYYVTGTGPDNTGANNDFSEPVFITSTVGCSNQNSIVFMPQGLMFQSDRGIWLLDRSLNTTYIGAPADAFFDDEDTLVLSAVNVPNTNQVRFTLNTGVTLMYDFYMQQWGSFTNVPGISSCIYQGLHTFVNSSGEVFQETPGTFLDGARPVLISLTTGWFNLAGLQGFERAYFFYLLGDYLTPHKLSIQIAYDYNESIAQTVVISPDNFNPTYGSDAGFYGSGSPYGGNDAVEQWRIFFEKQKTQAFQITITEIYDPSYGVAAGAGFTLSGLALVVGAKKGYTAIKAARSAG